MCFHRPKYPSLLAMRSDDRILMIELVNLILKSMDVETQRGFLLCVVNPGLIRTFFVCNTIGNQGSQAPFEAQSASCMQERCLLCSAFIALADRELPNAELSNLSWPSNQRYMPLDALFSRKSNSHYSFPGYQKSRQSFRYFSSRISIMLVQAPPPFSSASSVALHLCPF